MANSPDPGRVLRFRTGAAMPSRLGSEQLRDDVTAVIELVKNAYDADARHVTVEFVELEGQQSIRVQDDGTGMTLDDLHSKWAFLATENKVHEERSRINRRRRLGQKGVGRFAAEKLGSQLILRTRSQNEERVLQIRFDWDTLQGDRELLDYEFPVRMKKPKSFEPMTGVTLDIRSLRSPWKRKHVVKLRQQLARLIDPEETATDFEVRLKTPWPDLNEPLENPLRGHESHALEFQLDADGQEEIKLTVRGRIETRSANRNPPPFGPIRGKLRYFSDGLPPAERGRGGDPEADWNVGIRIFRDGCRVRPYGEPGYEGDWLQTYRTRYLKGSRFRLKPHYLEGTVHISIDTNPKLRDTTSREGLEANECYHDLVDYVQTKVLELSELVREEEIRTERARIQQRYRRVLDPLSAGLQTIRSEQYRSAVAEADREVRKGLGLVPGPPVVRNAHWECLDCSDAWKAPRNKVPTKCREWSVGRDGEPTNKPGCGSANIRRKENIQRDDPVKQPPASAMDDVMAGLPAYVSGTQLKPIIDWEMGKKDDEAEVRAESRELAINGRHPAFHAADLLDGSETAEGTALEELRAVAGLTIHVVNAAAHAWGRWHFKRAGERFDEYLSACDELKKACLSNIEARGTADEESTQQAG